LNTANTKLLDCLESIAVRRDTVNNYPPKPPSDDDDEMPDGDGRRTVRGSFLVAAYRRPEFRVDATLSSGAVMPRANSGLTPASETTEASTARHTRASPSPS